MLSSGEIARNRLKYLILRDRISCTEEMLEYIIQDATNAISAYIDIDCNKAYADIKQKNNKYILNISVPLL